MLFAKRGKKLKIKKGVGRTRLCSCNLVREGSNFVLVEKRERNVKAKVKKEQWEMCLYAEPTHDHDPSNHDP